MDKQFVIYFLKIAQEPEPLLKLQQKNYQQMLLTLM